MTVLATVFTASATFVVTFRTVCATAATVFFATTLTAVTAFFAATVFSRPTTVFFPPLDGRDSLLRHRLRRGAREAQDPAAVPGRVGRVQRLIAGVGERVPRRRVRVRAHLHRVGRGEVARPGAYQRAPIRSLPRPGRSRPTGSPAAPAWSRSSR